MQSSKGHKKSKEGSRIGNSSGVRHKDVQQKRESTINWFDPSQPFCCKAQRDKDPTGKLKNKESYSKYTSNLNTRKEDYKKDTKFLSVQNLGYFGSINSEKSLDGVGARRKTGSYPHSSTFGSKVQNSTFKESGMKRGETGKVFSSCYRCSSSSKKVDVVNLKKDLPKNGQEVLNEGQVAQKDDSRKDSSKKVTSDLNFIAVDSSINLTWNRRLHSGKGLINFDSQNEFLNFQDTLKTKSISVMGKKLHIQQSKNKYQFEMSNINPSVEVEDLEEIFQNEFPDIKPRNIELKFGRTFETPDYELDYIKKQIEVKCHKLNLKKFEVIVPKPKPAATIMKAFVNVTNGKNIDLASERFSECSISMQKCEKSANITARPVYRSLIKWDLDVCKAVDARMKVELAKLESELQTIIPTDDLFSVQMISTDATTAAIKMLTNNRDVMSELQKIINNLLEGEVLTENNFKYLDKFFTLSNDRVLKNLGEKDDVLILADSKAKIVRIYGLKENCLKAKENIQSLLQCS